MTERGDDVADRGCVKRLALAAAILEVVDDVNGGDIPDHWGVAVQDTMSTPTRLGVAPGVNLEAAMELTACTAITILAGLTHSPPAALRRGT